MKTLPRKIKRSNLPPEWRNSPILRSRKGPLGRIVVHRYTGVMKNSAARTISQFEKNMGGDKEQIATLLEANGSLNQAEKGLVDLLRRSDKESTSLARLIAESKAEPAQVIKKASYGAMLLGQSEAYIQIGLAMPRVVRELRRHIAPKLSLCSTCQGKKMVPRGVNESKETIPCPTCKGEGGIEETSDHMEFAVDKLVEMSKMGKQPVPLTQIAMQQTNTSGGGGMASGLLEKIASVNAGLFQKQTPQAALPPAPQDETPIEAELVLPEDNFKQPS